MVMRVGIIGTSEGNGHPYSFSAIINGYFDTALRESGWRVIYDYVRNRDSSEFGFEGAKVTHVWTQSKEETQKLAKACLIPNSVVKYENMIGNVDAVIIARDDYENHFELARFFLEAGLHVFVDKPLSLNIDELKYFKPHLESGRLMSCSGMRYAKELDEVRVNIKSYGNLKLIRGTVLNSWEKYGVHIIDAIYPVLPARPVAVQALEAKHASVAVNMEDGCLLQVDALEDAQKIFHIDIFGSQKNSSHQLNDNFSMFRRMLWHFLDSVNKNKPVVPVNDTLDVMRILIAGQLSRREKRRVLLDEIKI